MHCICGGSKAILSKLLSVDTLLCGRGGAAASGGEGGEDAVREVVHQDCDMEKTFFDSLINVVRETEFCHRSEDGIVDGGTLSPAG